MKTLCVIIIILIVSISYSQDEKHIIDINLEECLDIDSNQTTYSMIDCSKKAIIKWDKELNHFYNLLIENLSIDEAILLKLSQNQWTIYREQEFQFSTKIYNNMDGTIWNIVNVNRHKDIVRSRAIELKEYYNDKFSNN
jgi:uncharacterized protein YecT (DUF1311 family)